MRFAPTIVACMVLVSAASGFAAPARFWISTSKDAPLFGEAPTIDAPQNRDITLYIWAQPASDQNGFHPFEDFSLDIVSLTASLQIEPSPFIDFVDGTFIVYNGPNTRFQYVADSLRGENQGGPILSAKMPQQVGTNQPDALKGLEGFSVDTTNMVGIGNATDLSPYKVQTASGPAWRVAEFGLRSLQNSGTNTLFLQIGSAGMVSPGVEPLYVFFGSDIDEQVKYNAACSNQTECSQNWQTTKLNDSYDLQITGLPFYPGDFNSDGSVGTADYTYWRSTFIQSIAAGTAADANNDGFVDAADYVVWRKGLPTAPSSFIDISALSTNGSVNVIPEPATATLALLLISLMPQFISRRIAGGD